MSDIYKISLTPNLPRGTYKSGNRYLQTDDFTHVKVPDPDDIPIPPLEFTFMPTGTDVTFSLVYPNLTIDLASTTGDVTFTISTLGALTNGSILLKQDSTARDITWDVGPDTLVWLGQEPDWSLDDGNSIRVINWRYSTGKLYLWSTGTN